MSTHSLDGADVVVAKVVVSVMAFVVDAVDAVVDLRDDLRVVLRWKPLRSELSDSKRRAMLGDEPGDGGGDVASVRMICLLRRSSECALVLGPISDLTVVGVVRDEQSTATW
jgi:hypothetical protein